MPVLHTPREVGALVREARTRAKLTQAELAARIGASRFWVVAFEAGKARAELGLVLKALRALGLTLVAEHVDAPMPRPHPVASPKVVDSAQSLERLRALFGEADGHGGKRPRKTTKSR